MTDHDLGKQLAAHRGAAGMTQQQLADATAYSRSRIAAIETGRTVPPVRFWQAADDATGAGGALLAGYTRRQPTHVPVRSSETEEDVNRRALLALMAGAATSPIASELEAARRGVDRALRTPSTGRDAAEWEEVAADYANAVGLRDPATVLPAITADFADLSDRIAAAPGTVRTSMVEAAANMAALTAITLGTMRAHDSETRWWRTSVRAAAEVDDPALMARITGKQAVMALYRHPLTRVLDIAQRAIAQSNRGAALSGLAARTQALARLGRDDEALASLQALTDKFDSYDGDTGTTHWGWGERRLRFVETEVHAFAGRTADTIAARDHAMQMYPSTSWAGPAQIEANVALSQVHAGNVAGGVAHMMATVSRLQPWQRTDAFVVRSANDVVRSIDDPRRQLEARNDVRALLGSGK